VEKVNKTELKNFAIQSRRQLIDQVKTKALMYGIDEKNDLEIQEQFGQLMINDKPYPLYMKPAFNSLKNQLKQKGYKQLVEEVAYTWFNRIIAIRYMEVHDYLPEKVNVLSSSVGRVDPDILFEYETMDLPVKQEEIRELLHAGDTERAYRKLFIAQCNALNIILPFLFEKIQDYTELLLPDFLLDAESVIKVLVQNVELTNSFEEIEVIGWLYQYYIAEEKDRVFAQKSKYKKEEIPFATQLFTPKWIVQYLVQNSLGRYWTEAHREDENLFSNWEYFIKHEEEDFHESIAPYVNKELRVEDIKLLDPAMGSGHILVYAFEVFHQIYEKCGYPERDIPRLIIENNLYGLDIDDRAYQLATFAVVMKATSYSRRFLRIIEREGIQLNLASIQETNQISDDVVAYIAQERVGSRYNEVKLFFDQYKNAKIYGAFTKISNIDLEFIQERLDNIILNPSDNLFDLETEEFAKTIIQKLLKQTKILSQRYDVIVTNPPYLGQKGMDNDLKIYLNQYYPDSKTDLSTVFMENATYLTKTSGYYAMINIPVWMYSSSYENLRKDIIQNRTIINLLHLGRGVFGSDFGTVAFIIRNQKLINFNSIFKKLFEKHGSVENNELKRLRFFDDSNKFFLKQSIFEKIPQMPLSYDMPKALIDLFKEDNLLGNKVGLKAGLTTGDNTIFQRSWYEVNFKKIGFEYKSTEDTADGRYKWFPCNSGGDYRKWFGNNEIVVDWENDGERIRNFKDIKGKLKSRPQNTNYYFNEGFTWTKISSGKFGVRYKQPAFIFDDTGRSGFINKNKLNYIIGLLCSKVAFKILSNLNPSMSFTNGDIHRIPLNNAIFQNEEINNLVVNNIQICKRDWDSFETSWEFSEHPLIQFKHSFLKDSYKKWVDFTNEQFKSLKENEELLNSIFLNIYCLQDEISPTVEEKEVTIQKADLQRDVRSLLSYFIGCLTGRYSLDIKGLNYAGGEFYESNYKKFIPQPFGIVHISNQAYFKNDIITRLREFLSVAFSPDTIDENIQWLAESLEMKKGEDAEARIRRYFIDEFFEDHCKMYQKRPIYWLVDSGKQKGLRSLIYMHRYQPDTMSTIRFEHLQEIQAKYQNEITDIENRLVNPNLSASEKKKLTAEKVSFEKKMDELREFDKRLAEIANEEIEIDLDVGVKVNYEMFYRGGKGVLAKIK